jgi:hypothetical protein
VPPLVPRRGVRAGEREADDVRDSGVSVDAPAYSNHDHLLHHDGIYILILVHSLAQPLAVVKNILTLLLQQSFIQGD